MVDHRTTLGYCHAEQRHEYPPSTECVIMPALGVSRETPGWWIMYPRPENWPVNMRLPTPPDVHSACAWVWSNYAAERAPWSWLSPPVETEVLPTLQLPLLTFPSCL